MRHSRTVEVDGQAQRDELSDLAVAAAGGDDLAWRRLWQRLEPRLLGLVRRPRLLGPLALREDDCRNIVVGVMERLHADGRRRLVAFADSVRADPSRPLWPWLVVVTRRVAIDYLRAHDEYLAGRGGPSDSRPAWAHHTTASDLKVGGRRPPMTSRGTARELFELAAHHLTADQRVALDLWLRGEDHAEIAAALGLPDRRDSEKLVRAALARLRRAVREREAP